MVSKSEEWKTFDEKKDDIIDEIEEKLNGKDSYKDLNRLEKFLYAAKIGIEASIPITKFILFVCSVLINFILRMMLVNNTNVKLSFCL